MIKMTRGLALVVVIGAWLAGILLESWVSLPAFALLAGACAALLCLIPLWRDSQARLIMFIILWLLLGAWRFAIASPTGDAHAISAFIGTGQVEVRGTVADEPKLSGRSRLVQIDVSGVSKNGGRDWQNAHGQLEAETLGGEIEDPYGPNYGDNVELQGKVQAPIPHSSPGIFASMAFPRISVNSSGGNPIIAALYHFRMTLATLISQSLPQSESALLIAILLSLRTPALKPLIPFFNETGTAHLIAPSGFKVTILAGLVAASTQWLYEKPGAEKILPAQKRGNLRHWIATVLTISSIAAYTMLNGAGPAALRAGIMGLLLVLAPRLGRIYNIYTALALTALLMSLFDPFIVWDAGFQLSFLGTLGIVLFTPLFQRLLQPIERLPSGHFITEIIAVTLAAQIATLPIFALDFNQISFIAPIANTLTVPLLGIVIFIGILMCGAGLLFAPLATVGGWVAWPVLWYMSHIVIWCAQIPDAFIQVNNVSSGLAWCYFALLSFLGSVVLYKWPAKNPAHHGHAPVLPMLSRRTWRILQVGAALVVILTTGATVAAVKPTGQLTITFLSVAPANQAPQGEAILITTADGKTALIDGGLDATSLGQELDSRLPVWQRSLDFVMLTSPKSDHLDGLQDIVSRYQIGEVVDAGMLHPSTGYALWRRTISQRNLHYVQARQGTELSLGAYVELQVLWPPSPLHKSSNEDLDNGLVVRLMAPGLHMLLVGVTALSKHALSGLLSAIDSSYLRADIVQIVAEAGKVVPTELSTILQEAKPSLVVITPSALSAKQRRAGGSTLIPSLSHVFPGGPYQVVQMAQTGALEIDTSNQGWVMNV